MLGDFAPHVFVTGDYGRTWAALATPEAEKVIARREAGSGEPRPAIRGHRVGLYARWTVAGSGRRSGRGHPERGRARSAIHPREGRPAGGHARRGVYVIDDLSPLRSLTADKLAADAAFLGTRPNALADPEGAALRGKHRLGRADEPAIPTRTPEWTTTVSDARPRTTRVSPPSSGGPSGAQGDSVLTLRTPRYPGDACSGPPLVFAVCFPAGAWKPARITNWTKQQWSEQPTGNSVTSFSYNMVDGWFIPTSGPLGS